MSNHVHAKKLYLEGKSITEIATFLAISRTSIYSYKNKDEANGIDWDELKFLHATDAQDAQRNEEDFVALLIFQFEKALEQLNNDDPEAQIKTISKYITIYYKLKQQRGNIKIDKATVAKEVLQEISEIALEKEATSVIEFLSTNADQIVSTVIQ